VEANKNSAIYNTVGKAIVGSSSGGKYCMDDEGSVPFRSCAGFLFYPLSVLFNFLALSKV
jgi:hypothetical protein